MNLRCSPIACALGSLAVLWATVSALGSAASSHIVNEVQPDGAMVRVRNMGGEWFHWHETEDGYVVARDTDGFWKHCRPKAAAAEFEIVPDAIVGRANPAVRGFKKKELPAPAAIREHIGRLQGGPALRKPGGAAASGMSSSMVPEASDGGADGGGSKAGISMDTRTVKCIVILAAFDDHWDTVNNTVLTAKGRPAAEYDPLFNQVGYNLDGTPGSVRDFYAENSYGKLTVSSVVTGWVRLPQTESYYGDNANEVSGAARAKTMVADAIAAADAAGFDFSQGDGDGDGFVDLLHVIHSGHSEAFGGNPSTSMWPRYWWLNGSRVLKDGVGLFVFSYSSALRGSASTSTSLCRIGEICHELGHQFGLPDLYDVGGITQGAGTWCCMSGGSWGAVSGSTYDGRRPVHFSAHCKQMLGFVQPRVVHSEGVTSLPAIETNAVAHLVRDGSPSASEYFLIENRQPYGFDSLLPGGLLIWHVKNDVWRNETSVYANPAVRLEEANGANSLVSDRYASTNHTWKSTTGLPGGFRDQTGDSDSNAMVYQVGSQYNRTDTPSSYTRIRMSAFSPSGATMSYTLQTVVPVPSSQNIAAKNYAVSWTAASDATDYELQEATPGTVVVFNDGAEDPASLFENWNSTGLARRSAGSAKSGSYSYMLASKDETNSLFLSFIQSLQTRAAFKVTPSTSLGFSVMSHISTGRGYLRVELSKNNGATWLPLDNISNYFDPWTQKTYNASQLVAAGINVGDTCLLRFVGHIQDIFGWSGYPNYGFALDDIALSGIEMAGQPTWTTIATGLTSTAYAISNKPPGTYSYRVRARIGGTWQPWSPAADTQRLLTAYETWVQAAPANQQAESDDADGDAVGNLLEYAFGRVVVSSSGDDGPQQLPTVVTADVSGSLRLVVSVNLPSAPPSDVTYRVQVADELAPATWSTIATKTGNGPWTGTASVSSSAVGAGRTLHAVTDVASGAGGKRFMRLMVSH